MLPYYNSSKFPHTFQKCVKCKYKVIEVWSSPWKEHFYTPYPLLLNGSSTMYKNSFMHGYNVSEALSVSSEIDSPWGKNPRVRQKCSFSENICSLKNLLSLHLQQGKLNCGYDFHIH